MSNTAVTSAHGFKARLSDVISGDILLIGPDQAPDASTNKVLKVDGSVGVLAIIDFEGGTSTAPITTNPWCWIAHR